MSPAESVSISLGCLLLGGSMPFSITTAVFVLFLLFALSLSQGTLAFLVMALYILLRFASSIDDANTS